MKKKRRRRRRSVVTDRVRVVVRLKEREETRPKGEYMTTFFCAQSGAWETFRF